MFFAQEAQASAPVNRRQMKLSPRGECDFLAVLRAKADQIGTFGGHPIFALLSLHGCRRNRSLHDILAFPSARAAACRLLPPACLFEKVFQSHDMVN